MTERLHMMPDPFDNFCKSELVPLHGSVDECLTFRGFDLKVKTVTPQENVRGSESDPLVAVKQATVIAERFHQRRSLFFDGIVVASLRTKNSGLNSALIADALETAEHLDQSVLHQVDFGYREVIRHLLREALQ